MTIGTRTVDDVRWWAQGIALAVAVGALLAVSVELAIGAATVLAALFLFARSRHRSELLVGLYWIAWAVYNVVFYGLIIRFGFYPFYAAFLYTFVVALIRGGVKVDRVMAWLYVAFMLTILASFLRFLDPIDSAVIQRLLAYLVGAAVALQFRSRAGLRTVTVAAILASTVVAGYTIFRAVASGFAYRGGLDANPNGVAMIVSFGIVMALAWIIDRWGLPGSRWSVVTLLVVVGIMLYAVLVLASRGLTISLLLAFAVMLGRVLIRERRGLGIVLVIAVLAGIGLALPGGQNLVQRFTSADEQLQTAGSRIPIWTVTVQNVRAGDVDELLFGHGFDASEDVLRSRFVGVASTHSAYLQVLYEFGIVGLIVLVTLLGYMAWRGWRIPGRYGLIMLGSTTLLVLENVTGDVASGYSFWMLFGYLAAISAYANDADVPRDLDSRARAVDEAGVARSGQRYG